MNEQQRVAKATLGIAAVAFGALLAACSGGSNSTVPSLTQSLLPAQSSHIESGPGGQSELILGRITIGSRAISQPVNNRTHMMPVASKQSRPRAGSFIGDLTYHGGHTLFNTGSYNVYVNPTDPAHAAAQWSFMGGFIGRYSTSMMNHIMDQYTGATRDNRYGYLGGLVVSYPSIIGSTVEPADMTNILQAAANMTTHLGYRYIYHIFFGKGQADCSIGGGFCYGVQYCAYHGSQYLAVGPTTGHVIYSDMPWSQVHGCYSSVDTIQNDEAFLLSHEMTEAYTDPDLNAWYRDFDGQEIGDICRFSDFGSITLTGVTYDIQKEYLNSLHACAFGP